MSAKKDLNKIAQVERAIKEKYGEEAIQNPKKSWNKQKEEKYLKELSVFYESESRRGKRTEELDGFTLKHKKASTSSSRECPVCGSYSFESGDDLYMVKFECCFNCYIKYIEGREERWKSGWRPNN